MDAVPQPPGIPPGEFACLGGLPERRRGRYSLALSLLLHALAIFLLLQLPHTLVETPRLVANFRQVTPLTLPPREITQKAPNRAEIGKEFDLESLLPRARVFVPPAMRPSAPATLPEPGRPARFSMPEPPKLEAQAKSAPNPALGMPSPVAPPPQIQPAERPKLMFENPGVPSAKPTGQPGKLALPSTSVDEAVRALARGGSGGNLVVGDASALGGGIGEGLNLGPAPGKTASSLELLSDPQGVDFKPYLIRILAAVKRNWLAVIPQSVQMGRRGRASIQFAIDRRGYVPKLVIASSSGAEALDRAAVAGISASTPFPPLPDEFRGGQIRLQFTFLYNLATK